MVKRFAVASTRRRHWHVFCQPSKSESEDFMSVGLVLRDSLDPNFGQLSSKDFRILT